MLNAPFYTSLAAGCVGDSGHCVPEPADRLHEHHGAEDPGSAGYLLEVR